MTAVVETGENIGANAETEFTFVLAQNFGSTLIGYFRISATTDDRSLFADGLSTGGDITANWTVLTVISVTGTGGETFDIFPDQSILVGGALPSTTAYTLKAKGISGAVSGFRIELLEHPSLPTNGPGRTGNGNWVLSEFSVSYSGGVPFPNRAPRGTPDNLTATQGFPFLTANLLANDRDPEGDAISVAAFTQPAHGSVTSHGNGTFTYSPDPAFFGTDSFTYTPADPFQNGAPTLVTINVLPSEVVAWNNPAGGNFTTAANWTPARVPTGTDRAVIDLPGSYTVTLSSDASFASLTVGGTGSSPLLRQTSGTLTLNQNSTCAVGSTYELSGGTLTGSSTLTISGTLVWSSGVMQGTGTTRLAAGSNCTISSTPSKGLSNHRVFENQGQLVYSGSNFFFNFGGTGTNRIINTTGATFEIQGDADLNHSSVGTNAFENAGLLRKTGTGTTLITSLAAFTNTGTVQVEAGTLQIDGASTLGGSFDLSSNATLLFTTGTSTWTPGATVSGAGTVSLTGGTMTADHPVTLPNFNQAGGTLTGSSTLTVSGQFTWTGGSMGGNGTLILAVGGTGTFSSTGVKAINNSRVLENRGSIVYNGNNLYFGFGVTGTGQFLNAAGATLEIQGEADILHSSTGSYAVTNAGLLRKTGAGVSAITAQAVFSSTGTVLVEAGTLLVPGGTLGGTLTVNAGAVFDITGGGLTLTEGLDWTIDGTLNIGSSAGLTINHPLPGVTRITQQGGTVIINTDLTVATLDLISGTMAGSGNVTVSQQLNWSGSHLGGSGRLIVAEGANGSITSATSKAINDSRVIENRGVTTYSGSGLLFGFTTGGTGRIENKPSGRFEMLGGTVISRNNAGTFSFDNEGELRKSGAGTASFLNPIPLVNTGTVLLAEGTLSLAGGFTQNGTVSGKGTLTSSFTNNGIIRPDALPGPGLTLSGNLTQGAAGRIELTLATRDPSLAHRSLTLTGSATLNGTLQILTDPAFNEPGGSLFDVMTFATRSGDFAATEGLTGNPAFDFNRSFTGTALRLEVNSALPEAPETLAVAMPQVGQSGRDEVLSGQELAMAQPEGDADRDGVGNLLELAFGSDPLDASDTGRPELGPDLEHPGCLRFAVPLGLEAAELGFEVEYTNDMNLWHTLTQQTPGVMQMQTLTDIQGLPFLEVCIDPAVTGTIFLRVKVWQTQTK